MTYSKKTRKLLDSQTKTLHRGGLNQERNEV